MDEYIRMCEGAYEFQRTKRVDGDRLYLTNNLYSHNGKLSVINNETEPAYKKGYYIYNDYLVDMTHEDFFLKQCVYLPSQEIIQSYLKGPARYILTSFVNFVMPSQYGSLIGRHSFSELWLMFFYFHVYGKVWNGEDWIKADVGDLFT